MGLEKIDLNNEPENKPKIISYSETLPKNGESDEEYQDRTIALTRKVISGEIIIAKQTTEELNAEIELTRQEELRKEANLQKIETPKSIDSETQRKIDQMKKRKDLDY